MDAKNVLVVVASLVILKNTIKYNKIFIATGFKRKNKIVFFLSEN